MPARESQAFDARVFLMALVVLSTAYAAARFGFDLTFDESELAESVAPRADKSASNEFFELQPDDSAGLFLGSAALVAALLALIRPDPRAFLTALASLTLALFGLRLGFAAAFGDASVIAPELIDGMQSAVEPHDFASFIVAFVLVLLGMASFAVLQTSVGFCIGTLSLANYLLAVAVTALVVGMVVARRRTDAVRLQVSLGAIVACAVPIAYAGFRFETMLVPLIAGSVLIPVTWLSARIGASIASANRVAAED